MEHEPLPKEERDTEHPPFLNITSLAVLHVDAPGDLQGPERKVSWNSSPAWLRPHHSDLCEVVLGMVLGSCRVFM